MKNNKTFDLYDKDIRQKLRTNPTLCAQEMGYTVEDDVEVRVITSTKDSCYLVITNDGDGLKLLNAGATYGSSALCTPELGIPYTFCFCL